MSEQKDNDYTLGIREAIRRWVYQGSRDDDIERLKKILWVNRQFVGDWKTFPPSEIGLSESPIEALLFVSLLDCGKFVLSKSRTIEEMISESDDGLIHFGQQIKVGGYRLDFLFCRREDSGPLFLCVECDGWEHHYNSLEKVQEDNLRMINIAKRRIHIMRFLGSDLVRSTEDSIRHIKAFYGCE